MKLTRKQLDKGVAFQINAIKPRDKLDLTKKNIKGKRCFKYGGRGHIQSECSNVLKNSKLYNTILPTRQ